MKYDAQATPGARLFLLSALLFLIGAAGLFFFLPRLRAERAAAAAALIPPPLCTPAAGDGRGKEIELFSNSVLLYQLDEDRILYTKNADERCHPASLTKIMTVYAALLSLDDLTRHVTVTYWDLAGLYEANASMAGLQEGDDVSLNDLLYATMLPSGADAANTLARASAGSVEDFVAKMNETAAALGMGNTHFANVTGLDDPEHYTTAADLAKLLRAALQNETFRSVFCTASYRTAPTIAYPDGIELSSTLSQKLAAANLPFGPILGGKTGYTEEAGLCLATLAAIDGKEYFLITMGAEGDPRSVQTNVLDAFTLYDQCG